MVALATLATSFMIDFHINIDSPSHHGASSITNLDSAYDCLQTVKAQSLGKIVSMLVIGVDFGHLGKTLVYILPKEMQLHIQPFQVV